MARTVATGIQDFEKMIERNCFYVDKTRFIKEWWESQDDVTLITRPRRFGKTLTMNMVHQFFSTGYAGRGDLFEGLDIWKEDKYRKLQGTYPVIILSFANVKDRNYETVRKKICQFIADLYTDSRYLLDSQLLEKEDREFFKRISVTMDDADATSALNKLSRFLYKYYGKKVIILLDEYDAPMQEAYLNGYWDELVAFTRSLFNAAFKTNPYLERAIMTGVTRISKESIFSDLNNLKVVTTTSEKYELSFGFTEDEVFQALGEYGLSDQKWEVKKWYDGFTFGKEKNIYNPWSIINFLDEKKFKTYWVNSSSNELVSKLIREGSAGLKLVMEDLLRGKDFSIVIDEEIVFSQLDKNESAIWSLLLASGYLKVNSYVEDIEWGDTSYELAITNREVTVMFYRMFREWFAKVKYSYNEFIEALLQGDTEAMTAHINEITEAVFSYFDTGAQISESKEPEKKPAKKYDKGPENFYHGFVLGLITELRNIYGITSNRESGLGRYDVMLIPKDGRCDAIIIEFKVYDPQKENTLNAAVKNALQQIEEKKYAASLKEKGIPPERIWKYGFAFNGKTVLIGSDRDCDDSYFQQFQ